MVLFDVSEIGWGQIATIIGLPSIMFGLFIQIRSYKKSQREEQEKTRDAISKEINAKTNSIVEVLEARLELIRVASVVSKEDIQALRNQFIDLKSYVDSMDREGTIEWQKVKPFIMRRMDDLEKKIEELYVRSNETYAMRGIRMDQERINAIVRDGDGVRE